MKRAGKNDDGQRNKLQRIESPDEPMKPATKIVDLNDDCLMKIFGYLDLQSLFSVAIANEWLRPAANDVYKRKFGTKLINICKCDDYRPVTRAYGRGEHVAYDHRVPIHLIDLQAKPSQIHSFQICGLKTTLLYLRCFGSSIKDLKICYNRSTSKRYGYVHQYINDYCTESLVSLSFKQMTETMSIEQFQKNFVNVEEIDFLFSNFGDQSFFKCFPNLIRLRIYRVRTVQNFMGTLHQCSQSNL